jgi:hypothetical protein
MASCRAAVPEPREIAYFVPMNLANSSSNLCVLSPITMRSLRMASAIASSISSVTTGLAIGIFAISSPDILDDLRWIAHN